MDIKGLKITEAKFFPKPNAIFKEVGNYEKMTKGYGKAWRFNGLQVIATSSIMPDGREWLHVSFSRERKMPSYADLQLVKREFIGEDKKAVMVFPDKAHYVNLHKYCLHLFYSAENPLPEFSLFGSI